MNIHLYLQVFRFDHWIKNIFSLFGSFGCIIFFKKSFTVELALIILSAFLLSCFISSVNYIVNEILDSPFDKLHPIKKNRPIPSERVTVRKLWIAAFIVFFLVEVLAGSYFSIEFNLALLALFIAALFYNVRPIRMKDLPYLDVICESINNPIRLLIGWYAIPTTEALPPLSLMWLFWFFGAFLMTAKRLAEYRLLGRRANPYRSVFNYYSDISLLAVMIFYSILTVVFYGYVSFYYEKNLFFSLPLLIGFIVWFFVLTFEKRSIVIEPEHLVHRPLFFIYCIFMCIFTFGMIIL